MVTHGWFHYLLVEWGNIFIATVLKILQHKYSIDGKVRIALGHTRDVVLIDAHAQMLEINEIEECGNAFSKNVVGIPKVKRI